MIKFPLLSDHSGTVILFDKQLCSLQKVSGSNCTTMNKSFTDKHYQASEIFQLNDKFITLNT